MQTHAGDVVFQGEQFDISAVALHVGPDFVERGVKPCFERDGVQSVNEQQPADNVILQQAFEDPFTIGAGSLEVSEHARETVAIKTEKSLQALLQQRACGGVWLRLNAVDQLLQPRGHSSGIHR